MSESRPHKELPEYSALRVQPNRGLPNDLSAYEASDEFEQCVDRRTADLRRPENRPAVDDDVFVALLRGEGDGAGLIMRVSNAQPTNCVLVFTDAVRAADYAQVQLADGPHCSYWIANARVMVDALHGMANDDVATAFMFDRCPRCHFSSEDGFVSLSIETPEQLVGMWCRYAASRLERSQLYREYSVAAAQAGRLDDALQVALEAVGHTSPGDARLHLLIGKLGVARRDLYLVDEARAFLRYFEYFEEEQALEAAVRAGKADFAAE